MHVKPAPDLKVRDPVKRDYLPSDGRKVPDGDLYWARRLRDGDVVLVQEAANAVRAGDPATSKPVTTNNTVAVVNSDQAKTGSV